MCQLLRYRDALNKKIQQERLRNRKLSLTALEAAAAAASATVGLDRWLAESLF